MNQLFLLHCKKHNGGSNDIKRETNIKASFQKMNCRHSQNPSLIQKKKNIKRKEIQTKIHIDYKRFGTLLSPLLGQFLVKLLNVQTLKNDLFFTLGFKQEYCINQSIRKYMYIYIYKMYAKSVILEKVFIFNAVPHYFYCFSECLVISTASLPTATDPSSPLCLYFI